MTEEDLIQAAVFEQLAIRGYPEDLAFHVPNGGSRHPAEAAKLKRLGVKPGAPDIIILSCQTVFLLEIKTERGRLAPSQRDFLVAANNAGARVAVVYGIDEAVDQLEAWGLLRGTTTLHRRGAASRGMATKARSRQAGDEAARRADGPRAPQNVGG